MKMLKKGVKNNKKAYKNKNKYEPSGPKLIPESSNQEYFYSPLDGMLVHHRVTLGIKLNTWVERGTVRVKCLAKNTTQCPRRSNTDRSIQTPTFPVTTQRSYVMAGSSQCQVFRL